MSYKHLWMDFVFDNSGLQNLFWLENFLETKRFFKWNKIVGFIESCRVKSDLVGNPAINAVHFLVFN